MNSEKLGTLEPVDVRKAFRDEAKDFTPWLAENLNRLSSVLGIKLELEGKEVYVGSIRADIVARVLHSDERVLIENQLENANLQHLGQILAYLAGLDAKIVVWIAKGFDDEHLSAIRWLNEHTADPFAFFAVQVGVVQIGDSPLAPVFEILERPNKWDRQVQESSRTGGLSESGKFYRAFWSHYSNRWPEPPIRPGYAGNNVGHLIDIVDLRVYQYVSGEAVGVYLRPDSKEDTKDFEARVLPYRELFENRIEGTKFRSGNWWYWKSREGVDTRDQAKWDELAGWLNDIRQKYEEILRSGADVVE